MLARAAPRSRRNQPEQIRAALAPLVALLAQVQQQIDAADRRLAGILYALWRDDTNLGARRQRAAYPRRERAGRG